ncbi:hypothetical protein BDB01DRAFT_834855 [Pilobolus umbonatus]|nr:hypothetical protein BDB01DRAFT_834855 [Pilobolus umbonatus]
MAIYIHDFSLMFDDYYEILSESQRQLYSKETIRKLLAAYFCHRRGLFGASMRNDVNANMACTYIKSFRKFYHANKHKERIAHTGKGYINSEEWEYIKHSLDTKGHMSCAALKNKLTKKFDDCGLSDKALREILSEHCTFTFIDHGERALATNYKRTDSLKLLRYQPSIDMKKNCIVIGHIDFSIVYRNNRLRELSRSRCFLPSMYMMVCIAMTYEDGLSHITLTHGIKHPVHFYLEEKKKLVSHHVTGIIRKLSRNRKVYPIVRNHPIYLERSIKTLLEDVGPVIYTNKFDPVNKVWDFTRMEVSRKKVESASEFEKRIVLALNKISTQMCQEWMNQTINQIKK